MKYVAVRVCPRGTFLDGENALILNSAMYDTYDEAKARVDRQRITDRAIGPKVSRYQVLPVPDGDMLEI